MEMFPEILDVLQLIWKELNHLCYSGKTKIVTGNVTRITHKMET